LADLEAAVLKTLGLETVIARGSQSE